MDNLRLGSLISGVANKDAVHVAVAPVVAGEELKPGQHIGFIDREANTVGTSTELPLFGIVDPFLKHDVKLGQTFWVFLYPGSIRSLRHDWEHSEFATTVDKRSELWLRNWADGKGLDYDDVMMHAAMYLKRGEYWVEGGRFEDEYVDEEFWDHYAMVTGTIVTSGERGSFFSCSC